VLETGGEVILETRHWDEEAGLTHSMRNKEESSDYRYFTEPDLVPMHMDEEWVQQVRSGLPELPAARRARYVEFGLDVGHAGVLSDAPPTIRELFDVAVGAGAAPKPAANWLTGEVIGWLRRTESDPVTVSLTGSQLADLVAMVDDGTVSSTAAKEVLDGVLAGEGDPRAVATARDLIQISDTSALEAVVDEALAENPEAVANYEGGETKAIGFLVGQVMRATQGKADPKLVNELLTKRLMG
jgi:aspartyl-tRNA(Asn)/glutamyl-tRNA(Gln) amidotransferase subunit B